MTNSRLRTAALALALLGSAALAACSSDTAENADAHSEAAAPKSSSAGLPAGHAAAGEQLAMTKGAATGQSCVDCHGTDGNAPIDASYPKLGGQYASYIAHALQMYRNGTRAHALMSSQARGLTDQQIADLSVYFGTRESELRTLQGVH